MRHWLLAMVWMPVACSRAGDSRTVTLASATSPVTSASTEGPPLASASSRDAEPVASSPVPAPSSSVSGCAAPRVILTRGAEHGEALAVVAELLRVFPELTTLSFEARTRAEPCESTLEATCSDSASCARLATLFEQIDRTQRPRSVCEPRAEGESKQLAAPKPRQGAVAACARIRACELSTAGSPVSECDLLPEPGSECARKVTCAEVASCAEGARARRTTLPQPRLPRARPLADPCSGHGLGY